jgi:hypothetical protein
MKFNIYDRFILDVVRVNDRWDAFELDSGKRMRVTDFATPAWLDESQLPQYLDDIFHESAKPGDAITRID